MSKSLEEGRTLLSQANNNSLAAEFEAMSENEVRQAALSPQLAGRVFVGVEMFPSLSNKYKYKSILMPPFSWCGGYK